MNNEEKITISVNEEDVQNIINAYEKDIEYINQLEKENQRLKEIEKEHQRINGCLHLEIKELKKQVEEYENELGKADSIIQSCIFNGKKESEISYRKALNELEKTNKENQELQDRIDKAIEYIYDNDLFHEEYNGGCNCYFSSDSQEKKDLLDLLKGDKE